MIVSCRLRHRFEYTRKSAGMPNNRPDTDNLTLVIIITSAEERDIRQLASFSIFIYEIH